MRYSATIAWDRVPGIICTLAFILSSCQANSASKPSLSSSTWVIATIIATSSSKQNGGITTTPTLPETQIPIHSLENSPVQTTTATFTIKCPRTILFYGDSRLGAMGISFVENIKKLIGPCYNLINISFWAHTAVWGSSQLQNNVISKNPDEVVLWWGANDFNGCNGTTDQTTNLPDNAKFKAHLTEYLSAMKSQIETLLGLGKTVYVFDEPRVNGGQLPWAIEDKYGNVSSYDYKHLCSWNWVSDAVAAAQKQLVTDESANGHKVILVDVWQLYMDEGTLPDMYSTDVVHPGSAGREKIAELFLKAYQANSQH